MTTRADIARLAGVSESTVSYALSGKRPISDAVKKRVLAAVLAGGSPRMVTMMISNLFATPASRINGALVDGIVDGVRAAGFHSVIWPVSNDDESDVDLLLRSNFSGGVILMNDFKRESDLLMGPQLAACERVMRSGWFILGQELESFEREWGGTVNHLTWSVLATEWMLWRSAFVRWTSVKAMKSSPRQLRRLRQYWQYCNHRVLF